MKQKNSICAVVCSYNGRDYICKCVESLQKQIGVELDICVVDNGSGDGTYELLNQKYGDSIIIIRNQENLGGSGGFETGIQFALTKGYDYITLFDNDIVAAENAVLLMYKRLASDSSIGMVGARIMFMDKPDETMFYGLRIDYDSFFIGKHDEYCDNMDDEVECDYMPACALMTTREILIECGTMPVENFIYHDDAELCTNVKRKGYKLLNLRDALVWHKGGGARKAGSTFVRYYNYRNKWRFFCKYSAYDKLEEYRNLVIDEVFEVLYASHRKDAKEVFYTMMYAFDDFLHGIRGKAGAGRIWGTSPQKHERVMRAVKDCESVGILAVCNTVGYERALKRIQDQIKRFNSNAVVTIYDDEKLLGMDHDVVFELCEHVTRIKNNILPRIYFDEWMNVVADESDYLYFSEYDNAKELFEGMYKPIFDERIRLIRGFDR